MSNKPSHSTFTCTESPDPHWARQKKILHAHPEVRELFGHDVWQFAPALVMSLAQCGMAIFLVRFEGAMFAIAAIATALTFGAIANHWVFMSIHEAGHNMIFRRKWSNLLFSFLINPVLIIPIAAGFRKYHIHHHQRLGDERRDADLPSVWEVNWVGYSTFRKFIWIVFNLFFFIGRGLFLNEGKPTRQEIGNVAVNIVALTTLVYFFGGWTLLYLFLSTWFGLSFHPVAGHFVHEHYITHEGQETYSYYGPLNFFVHNAGYHVEHHDFMGIPSSRLPKLHRIAQEFYEPLHSDSSWTMTMVNFITDRERSLGDRLIRQETKK